METISSNLTGRSRIRSFIPPDGQSANSSWYGPVSGHMTRLYFLWVTIAFFLRHLLSDERKGPVIYRAFTLWLGSRRTHDHILLFHLRLSQTGRPGPRIYILQEQGGLVQSQSLVSIESVNQYALMSSPRGFREAPSERISIRHQEGYIKITNLLLSLGGLHVNHAVERRIWVPTQNLLWDQGNTRKNLIELADLRIFRMQTEI
jgi:hypothetical protein